MQITGLGKLWPPERSQGGGTGRAGTKPFGTKPEGTKEERTLEPTKQDRSNVASGSPGAPAGAARQVRLVRTDDPLRWAAACRRSGQPVTPFHSFPWLILAAEMTRSRFVPYIVCSGGADIGVVPWLSQAQGLVTRVNWMPFPYVGPLVPTEHLRSTLHALRRRAIPGRAIVQEMQLPPQATFDEADLERADFTLRYDSTYLVDTTRSEADLWSGLASSFRNKIRQAERKGVQVATSDDAQEALRLVVDGVFAHNGIVSKYTQSFPPSLAQLSTQGLSAHWNVATQGEVLIGSQVALLFEGRAVGWMGGVLPEFRNTHATVAMYWDTIRWARESGATNLDLVGTPNGGIDRFKSQFGGTRLDYPVLTWMAPGVRRLQDRKLHRAEERPSAPDSQTEATAP